MKLPLPPLFKPVPQLVFTRQQLAELGACELDSWFADSPRRVDENTLVYPDGWEESDTARLVERNPGALFFLIKHRLIPVTIAQAKAALSRDYALLFP